MKFFLHSGTKLPLINENTDVDHYVKEIIGRLDFCVDYFEQEKPLEKKNNQPV